MPTRIWSWVFPCLLVLALSGPARALKIVGFDLGTMVSMSQEFAFFGELAHAGKIAQGRFIARRR